VLERIFGSSALSAHRAAMRETIIDEYEEYFEAI
jgi:hypothetical protein